jgi:hypothetical protein
MSVVLIKMTKKVRPPFSEPSHLHIIFLKLFNTN